MKHKLSFLPVLFILTATLQFCSGFASAATKTYEDPDGLFKIEIPDTWQTSRSPYTSKGDIRSSMTAFVADLNSKEPQPYITILALFTLFKMPENYIRAEREITLKNALNILGQQGEVKADLQHVVTLKTRSGEWDALRTDLTFQPKPADNAANNGQAPKAADAKAPASMRGAYLVIVSPSATLLITLGAPAKDEAGFKQIEGLLETLDINRTEPANLPAPPAPVKDEISNEFDAAMAEGAAIAQDMQTLLNHSVEGSDAAVPPTDPQKSFDAAQGALKQEKPATHEKAATAQRAANAARLLAWAAFDRKDYAATAKWFDQSATLQQEAYLNLRDFHKARLEQIQPQIAEAKEKVRTATDNGVKDRLALNLKTLEGVRSQRIDLLFSLARANGVGTEALDFAKQLLTVAQNALEEAKQNHLPEADIQEKTITVANALETVGSAQIDIADFTAAQASYEAALALRNGLPASTLHRNLNKPLFGLGRLFQSSGNYSKSIDYYQQADAAFAADAPERRQLLEAADDADLKLMLQTQDIVSEVVSLNNIGVLYTNLDNYREALSRLQSALKLLDSVPKLEVFKLSVQSLRATTIGNIAVAHAESGEEDSALQDLQEVVRLRRASNESAAVNLDSIAKIYQDKGDLKTSRSYVEQARQLYTLDQDLRGVVSTTLSLASLALDNDDLTAADASGTEALTLARQTKDFKWIAGACCALANIRIKQNKLAEVPALLDEARAANTHLTSPYFDCYIDELEGRVLEAKGDNQAAAGKYKKAIATLESIRSTVASETAFANQEDNYELYDRAVHLFIKMGQLDDAFDYLNRAKSKQLTDSLRLSSIKTGDKALQALLDRGAGLENKLRSVEAQLQDEQAKPNTERDDTKIKNLSLVAAATQKEFFAVSEQIKLANPNYEKVLTVKPRELKAAQRSIPDGVAFIEYAPLGDQLYIFLVTRDDLKIYTPPVKPDDLWAQVKEFRQLIDAEKRRVAGGEDENITDWMSDAPTVAPLRKNLTALYDMLIAPIEPDLKNKTTLAFIPTQLLYYLPLPALAKVQDGKLHFLVEDKQITFLAAADVLSVAQPRDESRFGTGMIAFGNPAGADLPFSLEEVQSIQKVFPAAEVLSGAQATKSVLMDEHNLDKRILHFATHGVLNTAQPLDSYIQLASGSTPDDSELKLSEVAGLDLNKVDLVTLSACQTALGQRTPDGTEITGLANAFSVAGAQSVIASLWSVSDESTKTMMTDFYTHLAAGDNKAAALQKAQLALLNDPQYRHPFFWAPFILMGDWR